MSTEKDCGPGDAENWQAALDEIDHLRSHAASLHRLNGWSKAHGWWCSCQTPIVPRSMSDGVDRPWSKDGRRRAVALHAVHVRQALTPPSTPENVEGPK